MKQMTLIEMDGFLKGKCIPRDLKVNETNAEYLVRKFGELESKLETALRECRSAGITIDNLEGKCEALLDELERKQQYIKRRDQENEDIALKVGKLRVELEAADNNLIDSECHVAELEEALRDKQALLEASEKRIAELESMTEPRLPHQAPVSVPDAATAIRACIDEFPESVRDIVEECASIAETACRDAILQDSEPETDNTNQQFESLSRGDK